MHEPIGQPIEQIGMRRPRTHVAEVAGRSHQPFAEMMLPDAIHDHASGERIFGAGDPAGQCEAPQRASFSVWREIWLLLSSARLAPAAA